MLGYSSSIGGPHMLGYSSSIGGATHVRIFF